MGKANHDSKIIIGLAGPTASGKTSVARMLEDSFGAYCIRYSEILAEIARERGLKTDKATLQNLYLSERKTRGEDFLAKLLEKRVEAIPQSLIVIEGNRRRVDIELLEKLRQEMDAELRVLFIEASSKVRFARYNARQKNSEASEITYEEFLQLENNATENEILIIRDLCHKKWAVLDTDELSEDEVLAQAKIKLKL